jgi:hypothetical protein
VEEPEDDHRDAEEDEDALQEPPQNIGEHGLRLPSLPLSPLGRG